MILSHIFKIVANFSLKFNPHLDFFDLSSGVLQKKSHFSFIIRLSLGNIIGADIATASVLIPMGALLGRISPVQLLVLGLIEIVLFASNEYLQIELMKVRKLKSFKKSEIYVIKFRSLMLAAQ